MGVGGLDLCWFGWSRRLRSLSRIEQNLLMYYFNAPLLLVISFKCLHILIWNCLILIRILPDQSQLCTKCQHNEFETLQHALMDCPGNQGVSTILWNGLKKYQPTLTKQDILTINFQTEEHLIFSLVWITASFLSSLWQLRVEKKRVELMKIRTDMEASVRLLRESRLTNTIEVLSRFVNLKNMKEKSETVWKRTAWLYVFETQRGFEFHVN